MYTYCSDRPTVYVDPDGNEKSAAEIAYEQYQWHSQMAVRLQASGADPTFVASFQALAENFKRLAIQGPGGNSGVPALAAVIPGLGSAVKSTTGSEPQAVAAYRNLTGHSALHTQQTTAGAGALIAGLSTAAAVGMRYSPMATSVVVSLASKPIADAMHFPDPAALRRTVMRPAETVNRIVNTVEKTVDLLQNPPSMDATPRSGQGASGGGGGGWTTPPPGVDAEHYKDLGADPAQGGKWRKNEADTALRVEQTQSVSLRRYFPSSQQMKGDWVDQSTGEIYDGCSPPASQFFDAQIRNGNYANSLTDHANHPSVNRVIVDTTGLNLTQAQQTTLDGVINNLTPTQRAKIVRIR
jgi:hypothetical protein